MGIEMNRKKRRYWGTTFEFACNKYIDSIAQPLFNVKHEVINYEITAVYNNETSEIRLCFDLPSFPFLFIKHAEPGDARKPVTRKIKSQSISKALVKIEKEFNSFRSLDITEWMKNCTDGQYDDLMLRGIEIIADYLSERFGLAKSDLK